ncbi:MAG: hypothetical protein JWN15_3471 [Firmicutes bacterium]|nr:hypothetical protein [Bacillota bacterium]
MSGGLSDDLTALLGLSPGQAGPSSAPTLPTGPVGREWQPGVAFDPSGAMTVVTAPTTASPQDPTAWKAAVEALGLAVPEGWDVQLTEAKYDPAAWTRSDEDAKAVTQAVWRLKFRVAPSSLAGYGAEDVAAMVRDAMRVKRTPRPRVAPSRGLVVAYADAQTGKVDRKGGTPELVARIAEKFDRVQDHVRDLKAVGRPVDSAVWMDAGDCIEGQQNVPSQIATNDLTMTEMVRLHRRITFDGLARLARQFDQVTAAVCASNHAQHRVNGKVIGPPSDDWGIETLQQVADAFGCNPDAFGHVKFILPERWQETVSVDIAGTVVGLAHGHQVRSPGKIVDWWRGQTFGEQPVAAARILLTGHFHHFHAQEVGAGKLWLQAPALDNGSTWYTNTTGEESRSGLMVFSVGADGWSDLAIL